jgi:hypothetical protein
LENPDVVLEMVSSKNDNVVDSKGRKNITKTVTFSYKVNKGCSSKSATEFFGALLRGMFKEVIDAETVIEDEAI